MATVTGITVARAQAIEDASIVNGHISGGNLFLVNHGGAEINAGQVVPSIPPVVAAWPIGSVFMAVVPTNPATLLGGGTWIRWGQGRMPISQDSSQVDFDTAEEVGGEKTHVLSIGEMPAHNHGGASGSRSVPHVHDINLGLAFNAGGGSQQNIVPGSATSGYDGPDHTHAIASQGGGAAMNNMSPYIVVYMWKRTA